MGKLNGVADFIFLSHNKCGALELKSLKGKQGPSQAIFQKWCETMGVSYGLVNNFEDAVQWIDKQGF